MAIDLLPLLDDCNDLARTTASPLARELPGSDILAIAAEVNALRAQGAELSNFTVGDFDPNHFRMPQVYVERIYRNLREGRSNYPPAVGIPELRQAICDYYERELGIRYTPDCVQVGSGARPPIYAAFATTVAPGDTVVYQVPSWNVHYYVTICQAQGVPLVTRPQDGFLLTADALAPHLSKARLLVLNSPLNPSGTVMARDELKAIGEAIVAENERRRQAGDRPLMLLYDQVYWELTFGDRRHYTPVELVPEMARYTIMVDAVSKCWAATGVRVGWSVGPPWVRDNMQALVGHMGAWAPRAEQHAAAELLTEPSDIKVFLEGFRGELRQRLERLREGLLSLRAKGMPIEALEAQGAIYLTVRIDLIGRTLGGQTLQNDDDVRRFLLQEAGVAVVPFSSFGYPGGSGWMRFSVGACSLEEVDAALHRLEGALAPLAQEARGQVS